MNNNMFIGLEVLTTPAKLLELEDELVINGIVYDKYTLELKQPVEIINFETKYNEMLLKRMTYPLRNATQTIVENDNSWIRDSSNENVYYMINNIGVGFQQYLGELVKLEKKDNKNILTKYNLFKTQPDTFNKIIYQNDKFLFVLNFYNESGNGESINNLNWNLYKISKDDLKAVSIFNISDVQSLHIINITDAFIDVFAEYGSYIYIYRIDTINNKKFSDTYIALSQYCETLRKNTLSIIDDNIYTVCTADKNKWNILKINWDKKANKINSFDIMNIEGGTLNELQTRSIYTANINTFQRNNKKYLIINILLATSKNETSDIDALRSVKTYLFEIKNDDTLVLLDKFNEENELHTNILYFKEKNLLLLGSYRTFTTVKINNDLKFEKMYSKNELCMCYGISEDNKIYYQHLDTSIEELTIGKGITILSEFEKDVYDYIGQEISSNIKVAVKDIVGDYIDCNVRIQLHGHCSFNDGSIVKDIELSNLGYTTIPIIIKGESKLTMNVEIL